MVSVVIQAYRTTILFEIIGVIVRFLHSRRGNYVGRKSAMIFEEFANNVSEVGLA